MQKNFLNETLVLANFIKRDLSKIYNHTTDSNCECRALHFIEENATLGKPVQSKDIEKEFNLQKSTVSELLKQLEGKGYIYKESDPLSPNGRGLNIFVTEKGRQINEVTRALQKQILEKYETYLSAEDRVSLERILTRLIEERKKEQ